MATATLTRNDLIRKIEELEADSYDNLLRQAAEMELEIERDYVDPSQFIVRELGVYGYCELVNEERCTCRRFRLWDRCAHHALVLEYLAAERTAA